MFSKTSVLTGLIAAIGVLCFSIPTASGKEKTAKQTIGALAPCAEGEVAKKQADGSWACAPDADTSAAMECDFGQVLVADGTDVGVCVSFKDVGRLAGFVHSECPCVLSEAVFDFPWVLNQPFVCDSAQQDGGDGVCDASPADACQFSIRALSTAPNFQFEVVSTALWFPVEDPTFVCLFRFDGAFIQLKSILSQSAWDDCVFDQLALAAALGAACPAPPVVSLP